MKIRIYKLKFLSPLHIGTNRPEMDDTDIILHSDTLYSAILSAWFILYPEDRLFDNKTERILFPAFRLSSAFPHYGEHLFFPRPFYTPEQERDSNTSPSAAKKAKKIRFLEEPLFRKTALGDSIPFREECVLEPYFLLEKPLPVHKKPTKIFSVDDITRIRRGFPGGEETLPFQFTSLRFVENAGLFFLVRFDEDTDPKKFLAVLRFLGDSGLGADRSSGYGKFRVDEAGSFSYPESVSQHFITLSLFNPEVESLQDILSGARYRLLLRRGWVSPGSGSPYRRKNIRMFAEGSVFQGNAAERGRNLKVMDPYDKLGHPVYRFGQAFTYPFTIRSKNHGS